MQLPPIVALERPLSLPPHKSTISTKGQVSNHSNLAAFVGYMPLIKEKDSALCNSVGLTMADVGFKYLSGPQPTVLNDNSHLPQVPLITTHSYGQDLIYIKFHPSCLEQAAWPGGGGSP